MKISSVQLAKFNSNQTNINNSNQVSNEAKKQEGIDILLDKVKNPSDVNDCVAVPRGIFKAYILLMTSTGLSAVSSFIPKKDITSLYLWIFRCR